MANFPYIDHLVLKLIFDKKVRVNKSFVQSLTEKIVSKLKLNVVRRISYSFVGGGLTKVLILSQSHLICHTWPEHNFIHIDLMTCSKSISLSNLRLTVEEFLPTKITFRKLKY